MDKLEKKTLICFGLISLLGFLLSFIGLLIGEDGRYLFSGVAISLSIAIFFFVLLVMRGLSKILHKY